MSKREPTSVSVLGCQWISDCERKEVSEWVYHAIFEHKHEKEQQQTPEKREQFNNRQKGRRCYFGFLLTGPTGTAINNLVQYLTWDLVPGGDILAGFDAEKAPSPPPCSPRQFFSSP